MRKKDKGYIAIIIGIASVALLTALLWSVSVAWFYFPTTQNITIYSDIYRDIEVDLYQYVRYEDPEFNAFVQQLDASDHPAAVNPTATFFEWSGVFYAVDNMQDYYILTLTYPDSTFVNGYLEADLTIALNSGFTDADPNEANEKVMFTKLAYAIADDANLDPFSQEAYTKALAAEYTEIFDDYEGVEGDVESADFMAEREINISLLNLGDEQYIHNLQEGNQVRLVLFIRIENDADRISDVLEEGVSDLNILELTTQNIYTFSCVFRSVPYKSSSIEQQNRQVGHILRSDLS